MEQLSLLGLEPPIATVPPAVADRKKNKLKVPSPLGGIGFLATPVVAHSPPLQSDSPQALLPPAGPGGLLQHPQANRRAVLLGQTVAYWFRRGQRRTIGFSVGPQGLSVSAPRWTPVSAVESALQSKAAWVLGKLTQVGQRHEVLQAARVDWADGTELAWLGATLTVRLGQAPSVAEPVRANVPVIAARRGRGQPLVQRLATVGGPTDSDVVWVALPATASPVQLRDAVQAWMMQAAHAHFEARLNHFAPLLGVRWTTLKLSAAATRWGSAKADGSIRLHWRLMQFAPEVVDYVVAHELSHLRHMDHSERFWRTVATVVPDYAVLRARLKGERLPPW